MDKEMRTKLLDKQMNRRDFLQLAASSVLVLFGLSNIIALLNHTTKVANTSDGVVPKTATGFGSRKFGI